MQLRFASVLLLFLAGCTALVRHDLDQRFGPADGGRYNAPRPGAISFQQQVRPILDSRCVVCHSCYDAPCQIKLGSWEGVARGGSKIEVYNGTRLREETPTRLFIDAEKASQWRDKGFHPILNERGDTPAAALQASLLARALDLKAAHPLVPDQPVGGDIDFSLARQQSCPAIEEYDALERRNPGWGMPFGLPALAPAEVALLKKWLQQGAPAEGPQPLTPALQAQVDAWERFLNSADLKTRLMARYLYEHLFLANLYFEGAAEGSDGPRYFRLVRSRSAPGEKVEEIATRRPFDDPEVEHFHYRLRPVEETIVAKNHMPYALGPGRMARWRELFLQPAYRVERLPGYAPEVAANPFLAFRDIPVRARYQFLLDEAQFTVMGFIKGPVCRGQTALNVIDDHFWVFFQNPDSVSESDEAFLLRESRNLSLPAEKGSETPILTPWMRYSAQETRYLQAKSRYYEQRFDSPAKVNLNLIWDGGGRNDNAALTIYRHFDSATVLKGLVGEKPKTAWVLSYPLLERIHYLLVAGYDVFGNIGHQLTTRLYMDFLRMEGESQFLMLLPREARIRVRDHWYRDVNGDTRERVYGSIARFDQESGIAYREREQPERELLQRLQQRLQPVLPRQHLLDTLPDAALQADLQDLARVAGKALAWLPESSLLLVEEAGRPTRIFTLLRNTGHRNVTYVLIEKLAIAPEEHSLDVLPGIATAYPNAFYRVPRASLEAFARDLAALASERDYTRFMDAYGLRRSSPAFWALSDYVNGEYRRQAPVEAGWLDYNRLENR